MMRKIVVIGSNSFSGSHCVNYFLENSGFDVIGISRSKEYHPVLLPYLYPHTQKGVRVYRKNKSRLAKRVEDPRFRKTKSGRPARFKFYQLDLNKNSAEILKLLNREKPEVIVLFAAQGIVPLSWDSPADWFRTNCLGIVNLVNGLREKTYLKKYIQISTPEVYGSCIDMKENPNYFNPTTPYAASKAAGDLFLMTLHKKFSFPVSFTRSVNVYGPHQQLFRIIPKSIISIKGGQKIPLHQGGAASRSFIHITDVLRGIDKIITHGKVGEVYHFSTGKNTTIKELVALICEKMGVDFDKSVEINEGRPGQDATYELNFAKTSKELGWKPKIKLEAGVDGVISWINESWSVIKKMSLEYTHKK